MDLKNKVALITGGARIGATVATELARHGCNVALSYRTSRASAVKTSQSLMQFGVRTKIFKADVSVDKDAKKLVAEIRREFGRLDILVNMASVYEKTPWKKLNESVWKKNIDSNLKSAFLTVLHAAPLLRVRGGRVINFSDWVAASGRPRYKDFVPYYTAKAGVLGLTQIQALELAPKVLVNAIAPGPILPPKGISNEEVRNVGKVTPLGKWGGAMEIAKAVIFFCQSDFVTGECLRVDGGRHLY